MCPHDEDTICSGQGGGLSHSSSLVDVWFPDRIRIVGGIFQSCRWISAKLDLQLVLHLAALKLCPTVERFALRCECPKSLSMSAEGTCNALSRRLVAGCGTLDVSDVRFLAELGLSTPRLLQRRWLTSCEYCGNSLLSCRVATTV